MDKNRLAYLDVLRGIAVLTVLVHHMLGYIYQYYPEHPLSDTLYFLWAQTIDWGRYGVVLFFLISGFIIPRSLKPGTTITRFAVNRFFRLYPAFWATIIFLLLFSSYFSEPIAFTKEQVLANMTMIPKLFGYGYMNGVFWTLFIELLFYFCCIVIFKLKFLDSPIFVGGVAIGLLSITPGSILIRQYSDFNLPIQFISYHLAFLFFGNLLRLAVDHANKPASWLSLVYIMVGLISLPVVTGYFFNVPEATNKGFVSHTTHAVMIAYLLAVSTFIFVVINKKLNRRVFIELGNVSYSLYLIHMPCIFLVVALIRPSSVLSFMVYLFIAGICSYYLAKLSYKFIELPTVTYGRRLSKQLGL